MISSHSTSTSENRKAERVPTELRAVVQVKESPDESWKEVTKVTTVSRNGAGFTLSRKCHVGRLITLVLPLPLDLRAYDMNEELYPVMGVVQSCYEATVDGETVYNIGVGFVGKNIPESFKANPRQNYRISGKGKDGLWNITESDLTFKQRKHARYWQAMKITVSLIHRDTRSITKVEAVTKDIGTNGASVRCSLDAKVGDRVKFACRDYNFYTIAVIRNRKAAKGSMPTLHLEFIDNEFPMDKIMFGKPPPGPAGKG
jgi:hypothetical protein